MKHEDFKQLIHSKCPEVTQDICLLLLNIIEESELKLSRSIKWGCPTYEHKGLVVGVWGFKNHANLVVFNGAGLKGFDSYFNAGTDNQTSRTIKFQKINDIDSQIIINIIKASIALNESGYKIKTNQKAKKQIEIPEELQQALACNIDAAGFYNHLTEACKNEYNAYVAEAKRQETRIKRAQKSIGLMVKKETLNQRYKC